MDLPGRTDLLEAADNSVRAINDQHEEVGADQARGVRIMPQATLRNGVLVISEPQGLVVVQETESGIGPARLPREFSSLRYAPVLAPSAQLRRAAGEADRRFGVPDRDPTDCVPRAVWALYKSGVPLRGDDSSGDRDVDVLARMLEGSFDRPSVGMLDQLRPGARTAVWTRRPRAAAHVVLVEGTRIPGWVVVWDPHGARGDTADGFQTVNLKTGPLPASLTGPARFITGGDGQLAQWDPTTGRVVHGPDIDTHPSGSATESLLEALTDSPESMLEALTDSPSRTLPTGGTGTVPSKAKLVADTKIYLQEFGDNDRPPTKKKEKLAEKYDRNDLSDIGARWSNNLGKGRYWHEEEIGVHVRSQRWIQDVEKKGHPQKRRFHHLRGHPGDVLDAGSAAPAAMLGGDNRSIPEWERKAIDAFQASYEKGVETGAIVAAVRDENGAIRQDPQVVDAAGGDISYIAAYWLRRWTTAGEMPSYTGSEIRGRLVDDGWFTNAQFLETYQYSGAGYAAAIPELARKYQDPRKAMGWANRSPSQSRIHNVLSRGSRLNDEEKLAWAAVGWAKYLGREYRGSKLGDHPDKAEVEAFAYNLPGAKARQAAQAVGAGPSAAGGEVPDATDDGAWPAYRAEDYTHLQAQAYAQEVGLGSSSGRQAPQAESQSWQVPQPESQAGSQRDGKRHRRESSGDLGGGRLRKRGGGSGAAGGSGSRTDRPAWVRLSNGVVVRYDSNSGLYDGVDQSGDRWFYDRSGNRSWKVTSADAEGWLGDDGGSVDPGQSAVFDAVADPGGLSVDPQYPITTTGLSGGPSSFGDVPPVPGYSAGHGTAPYSTDPYSTDPYSTDPYSTTSHTDVSYSSLARSSGPGSFLPGSSLPGSSSGGGPWTVDPYDFLGSSGGSAAPGGEQADPSGYGFYGYGSGGPSVFMALPGEVGEGVARPGFPGTERELVARHGALRELLSRLGPVVAGVLDGAGVRGLWDNLVAQVNGRVVNDGPGGDAGLVSDVQRQIRQIGFGRALEEFVALAWSVNQIVDELAPAVRSEDGPETAAVRELQDWFDGRLPAHAFDVPDATLTETVTLEEAKQRTGDTRLGMDLPGRTDLLAFRDPRVAPIDPRHRLTSPDRATGVRILPPGQPGHAGAEQPWMTAGEGPLRGQPRLLGDTARVGLPGEVVSERYGTLQTDATIPDTAAAAWTIGDLTGTLAQLPLNTRTLVEVTSSDQTDTFLIVSDPDDLAVLPLSADRIDAGRLPSTFDSARFAPLPAEATTTATSRPRRPDTHTAMPPIGDVLSSFLTGGDREPARSLVQAAAQVEATLGPPPDKAADCTPRSVAALRALQTRSGSDNGLYGLRPVDSGQRPVDEAVALLSTPDTAAFFGTPRTAHILHDLRPGAATLAWGRQPGEDAHMVVIERDTDGNLHIYDPAIPGPAAVTPFTLDTPAGLPDTLTGPSRYPVNTDGDLAQWDIHHQQAVFGPDGDQPSAPSDGHTLDALTDPPTHTYPTAGKPRTGEEWAAGFTKAILKRQSTNISGKKADEDAGITVSARWKRAKEMKPFSKAELDVFALFRMELPAGHPDKDTLDYLIATNDANNIKHPGYDYTGRRAQEQRSQTARERHQNYYVPPAPPEVRESEAELLQIMGVPASEPVAFHSRYYALYFRAGFEELKGRRMPSDYTVYLPEHPEHGAVKVGKRLLTLRRDRASSEEIYELAYHGVLLSGRNADAIRNEYDRLEEMNALHPDLPRWRREEQQRQQDEEREKERKRKYPTQEEKDKKKEWRRTTYENSREKGLTEEQKRKKRADDAAYYDRKRVKLATAPGVGGPGSDVTTYDIKNRPQTWSWDEAKQLHWRYGRSRVVWYLDSRTWDRWPASEGEVVPPKRPNSQEEQQQQEEQRQIAYSQEEQRQIAYSQEEQRQIAY
ncbi:hypothetical protein, partial [Actinoplanes sp. NBRC 103695]|uniref:hypothetical protein n=1 Tax=Actinoplanes sp. NBRC 103695 TaxID=3032202 RepID=UPI002555E545